MEFRASAWKNGGEGTTGSVYGLRISHADRDRLFHKQWETVNLNLIGEKDSRVTEVNISESFWNRCPELRGKDIRQWFMRNGFIPWEKKFPPKFRVTPKGEMEFEVRPYTKNKLMSIPASLSALSFLACLLCGSIAFAQERDNTLSLDEERRAALERFDVTEVPDLDAIRAVAAELFAQPVERQDPDQLRLLSEEANRAANLVDYIYDEYNDYYIDNYEYNFVRKELISPRQEYGTIFNEFAGIRNQAYFNLGILSKNGGKTLESFMYFKDAFRLSTFSCGKDQPATECMRWKAEQELKKLLNLSHIESYVTWQ